MTLLALALAAALAALPPAPPTEAAPREVLTLEGALSQARARSLELKIASERLAQAETLSRKAWSYYRPQVSLSASYDWNSDDVALDLPTSFAIRQLVDQNGNPVNYPNLPAQDPTKPVSPKNPPGLPTSYLLYPLSSEELELERRQQYGVELEVQQALFAPQVLRAVESAGRAREVALARVEATTQDVLFGVAQLYYGAASMKEVIEVEERALETWRRHETDAMELVAQGVAPRLALLKARTDRARAEEDLIRSRNAYAGARQALATLLDRDADFDVMRPSEMARAEGDPEEGALLRPDVRAAELARELASGREREVSARYLPVVGLTGEWHYSSITGFTGKHDGWSIALGAKWALYDGGRREADGAKAREKTREAETLLDLSRNKARDEVRRAGLDLSSARAALRKAEEQSQLAAEALEQAQAAYQAGAATYLELSDATTSARNAELSRVTDGLTAKLSSLRLAKAAGEFKP